VIEAADGRKGADIVAEVVGNRGNLLPLIPLVPTHHGRPPQFTPIVTESRFGSIHNCLLQQYQP
jgi:hypothetical protein